MSFLKTQGVSQEALKYAMGFIHNVDIAVKQLVPGRSDLLRRFVADAVAYEHGVSTAMIAALIARELDMSSVQAVEVVGIASLLHDIGLHGLAPEIQAEDTTRMSPEQVVTYHQHPNTGALALKSMRGILPAVVQAVGQHHERNTKVGFPNKLGSGQINRIAEIVGISDELLTLVIQAKAGRIIDPWALMEETMIIGFSPQTCDAFRAVFISGKSGRSNAA
jgi:HD-GYP domain-containing protein (c-di-GMP phosphodiesterase class II)